MPIPSTRRTPFTRASVRSSRFFQFSDLVGRNHLHEGAPQSSPVGLVARGISVSRTIAPRGSLGLVSSVELSTAANPTLPFSRRSRNLASASRQVFHPRLL